MAIQVSGVFLSTAEGGIILASGPQGCERDDRQSVNWID